MSEEPTPEQRLARSSLELPAALPAFGQYVPAVLRGSQLWVGGHSGTRPDGSLHVGRCGQDVSVGQAREAARSAAINLLATAREALGTLDRVEQVVQAFGTRPRPGLHAPVLPSCGPIPTRLEVSLAAGCSSLVRPIPAGQPVRASGTMPASGPLVAPRPATDS